MAKAEARKKAVEMLSQVRVPDPSTVARRYAHQLSGGQLQRVLIAKPYPPMIASTYSARCAGPEGITVLDAFERWLYQHGLRHMGEIELARGLVGLGGMTS